MSRYVVVKNLCAIKLYNRRVFFKTSLLLFTLRLIQAQRLRRIYVQTIKYQVGDLFTLKEVKFMQIAGKWYTDRL